ncbi:hypothetical protein PENSPDRAFT_689063 [Peniophora sp. CONT]|nr:hypothetical protein PENSPDRAFT_689063 [Peniophora sp. CONT]
MARTSPTYLQSTICTLLLVGLSVVAAYITATLVTLLSVYNLLRPERGGTCAGRKTVLITGARNAKCLFLARAFSRGGCRVIVAEEPSWFTLNMTRFSRSVKRYYPLPDPALSAQAYKEAIVNIILREQVDMFLPCSSPTYTVLDSVTALAIAHRAPKCKCFIPHPDLVTALDRKDEFISLCDSLGMPVPASRLVQSVDEAVDWLHSPDTTGAGQQYITKGLAFDDLARTDMTPLPLDTPAQTKAHLERVPLPISSRHRYVVQRLLDGPEYCTHAAVRDGELVAFVTCRSSDMLMRYVDVKSLFSAQSNEERAREHAVGVQAEEWTRNFLSRWKDKLLQQKQAGIGGSVRELTGHFCVDFILNGADGQLYPIECNPRAHTAVVLFAGVPDLVSHYLGSASGTAYPPASTPPNSWLAHALPLSLATLLPRILARNLHPLLSASMNSTSQDRTDPTLSPQPDSAAPHALLMQYILGREVDPVWDVRDPVPFFVLAHLAWPWMLLKGMVYGRAWSRVNASTMRVWGAAEVK